MRKLAFLSMSMMAFLGRIKQARKTHPGCRQNCPIKVGAHGDKVGEGGSCGILSLSLLPDHCKVSKEGYTSTPFLHGSASPQPRNNKVTCFYTEASENHRLKELFFTFKLAL